MLKKPLTPTTPTTPPVESISADDGVFGSSKGRQRLEAETSGAVSSPSSLDESLGVNTGEDDNATYWRIREKVKKKKRKHVASLASTSARADSESESGADERPQSVIAREMPPKPLSYLRSISSEDTTQSGKAVSAAKDSASEDTVVEFVESEAQADADNEADSAADTRKPAHDAPKAGSSWANVASKAPAEPAVKEDVPKPIKESKSAVVVLAPEEINTEKLSPRNVVDEEGFVVPQSHHAQRRKRKTSEREPTATKSHEEKEKLLEQSSIVEEQAKARSEPLLESKKESLNVEARQSWANVASKPPEHVEKVEAVKEAKADTKIPMVIAVDEDLREPIKVVDEEGFELQLGGKRKRKVSERLSQCEKDTPDTSKAADKQPELEKEVVTVKAAPSQSEKPADAQAASKAYDLDTFSSAWMDIEPGAMVWEDEEEEAKIEEAKPAPVSSKKKKTPEKPKSEKHHKHVDFQPPELPAEPVAFSGPSFASVCSKPPSHPPAAEETAAPKPWDTKVPVIVTAEEDVPRRQTHVVDEAGFEQQQTKRRSRTLSGRFSESEDKDLVAAFAEPNQYSALQADSKDAPSTDQESIAEESKPEEVATAPQKQKEQKANKKGKAKAHKQEMSAKDVPEEREKIEKDEVLAKAESKPQSAKDLKNADNVKVKQDIVAAGGKDDKNEEDTKSRESAEEEKIALEAKQSETVKQTATESPAPIVEPVADKPQETVLKSKPEAEEKSGNGFAIEVKAQEKEADSSKPAVIAVTAPASETEKMGKEAPPAVGGVAAQQQPRDEEEDENFRARASKSRSVPVAEGNEPPDEHSVQQKSKAARKKKAAKAEGNKENINEENVAAGKAASKDFATLLRESEQVWLNRAECEAAELKLAQSSEDEGICLRLTDAAEETPAAMATSSWAGVASKPPPEPPRQQPEPQAAQKEPHVTMVIAVEDADGVPIEQKTVDEDGFMTKTSRRKRKLSERHDEARNEKLALDGSSALAGGASGEEGEGSRQRRDEASAARVREIKVRSARKRVGRSRRAKKPRLCMAIETDLCRPQINSTPWLNQG
jgi:hypothetical protein